MDSDDSGSDESDDQVIDWRFTEYKSTNLATLQEVDLHQTFFSPNVRDKHWLNHLGRLPTCKPYWPKPWWADAHTQRWAACFGLQAACHPYKEKLHKYWAKLYKDLPQWSYPTDQELRELSSFPLHFEDRKKGRRQKVTVHMERDDLAAAVGQLNNEVLAYLTRAATAQNPVEDFPWQGKALADDDI